MATPSTRRPILVLAILIIALVPTWAQPAKVAAPPPSQQKELERQWKEVQARDPLVAVAYMELAAKALAKTSDPKPVFTTICSNPVFAKSPGCLRSSPSAPGGKACPPPCKLPLNEQGIQGYLGCAISQVTCQL
jgi:hypothetical protein